MNKKLLDRIEELFIERLSRKTNWGRNEVIQEYRDAKSDAILELLESGGKL